MFLIIKLFFILVMGFFLLTFIVGVSLWARIQNYLQNPLSRPGNAPQPPPGSGEIIEGEYRVIDEKQK